ncbi:MAG TPA: flippase [Elusimicrobiales bacterium]|nr:flippase [Elusimicrobiales bacterium]
MIKKVKNFLYINDEFFVFPIIEKIKTKAEYRRLFSNFMSLSVLQAANYLFPLITFPYLVRVLGVEKFGLISFAQAFIQYFIIITDYGFNLSATREISIHRENKEKVNEIFSSVMIIKSGLFLISFIIMSGIVFGFEKFRKEWVLYYLTFGMVLGQVLFPVWFFQGMEQMKWITYLNIIAKGIFTVAVFVFINSEKDYYAVPILNSIGIIMIGVVSLFILGKRFETIFVMPNRNQILYHMKEGWYIFTSTIAITFYTVSNTFILGLITNNVIVGYYSISEKIVKVFYSLLTPIQQTVYPYFSKLIIDSKNIASYRLKKLLLIMAFIGMILSGSSMIFSKHIIYILAGTVNKETVTVLMILSINILAIGINNVLGVQGLIAFGYYKYFRNIVFIAAVFHIIILLGLIRTFGIIGAALSPVITEVLICLMEYYIIKKEKII